MSINGSINNAFTADYNAPNKSSKNLLIGGNFTTNPWQRGTSFVSPGIATYTADRWVYNKLTTGVVTITKNADSPTVAQAGIFSTHCFQIAVTTSSAAPTATEFCFFDQNIEGYNVTNIVQRPFTLSFWVNFNKTGIYCIAFRNLGGDACYIAEYTVNSANTWEKKTITVTASPSSGGWNYTTGVGLQLDFVIACGSMYQNTANSWLTTNSLCTSNQVNGLDSNTNIFKFALIQVESGSVATPFEQKSQENVLLDCQRYFFKTFPQATAPAQNTGVVTGCCTYRVQLAGATNNGQKIRYPVRMRVAPTTVAYSPSSASANWYNITRAATTSAATTINATDTGLYLSNAQNAADVLGNVYAIHLSAAAEL